MALAWTDDVELARHLDARFPDVDPLTIRFPDLSRWVAEVEGFEDGARPDTPRRLEDIQRQWYELYQQRS